MEFVRVDNTPVRKPLFEVPCPRVIRELIERNKSELERYGVLPCHTANSADALGRGRPGVEYWLNEDQALLICMRSDAPVAERLYREAR